MPTGHQFAAVNGNTIQIYSTYTCENIGNLRGHNGKVKSIYWTQDDRCVISAGMDGAVYEWQLKDFKRTSENVLKSCSYTCAVCTSDARSIFAVGSDRKMKEISDSNVTKEISDANSVQINQIVLSHSGRQRAASSMHRGECSLFIPPFDQLPHRPHLTSCRTTPGCSSLVPRPAPSVRTSSP